MAVHMPGKVNPARHHRIGERFGVLASSAMAAAPVAAPVAAPMAAAGGGAAAPMAAMGGGGGGAAAPMAAMGGGGAGQADVAWVLAVNPEAFVDAAGDMWVAGVNVGRQGVDW